MTERVSEDTPLAEEPNGDPLQPEQHASGQGSFTTVRSGSPSAPGSPQEPDPLPSLSAINSRGEPAEAALLQPGQHHFMSTGVAGADIPVRHNTIKEGGSCFSCCKDSEAFGSNIDR